MRRSEPDRFSAALCRGLIEARSARHASMTLPATARFPRLYAAASLKRVPVLEFVVDAPVEDVVYSAALCRGLIEAHGSLDN